MRPKISMLIWTYNRGHLVELAIESVLNQTYQDFELVLVNNGSTDNTAEIINKYKNHEKVRIFHLEENSGYQGGLKFALEQIRGEWFTELSDDDTIMEEAFEKLIKVPDEVNSKINAVTCNSIDTSTGEFAGIGLNRDQYLPVETIVSQTYGEFFGITKTELLDGITVNLEVPSYDENFWHLIDEKANRYYIHEALKVHNTDHGLTLSEESRLASVEDKSETYEKLIEDKNYWEIQRKYNQKRFIARCIRGIIFVKMKGNTEIANRYKHLLNNVRLNVKNRFLLNMISVTPGVVLNSSYNLVRKFPVLNTVGRLFFKRYTQIKS